MAIHQNAGDHHRIQATELNQACSCDAVNSAELHRRLESECAAHGLSHSADERPHLFAEMPYFVSRGQLERMEEAISAIECVVALPAYQSKVLEWAPPIARFAPEPRGVFFGYDFHLDGSDPRLIEINTNAGGALLNARLTGLQPSCYQARGGLHVLNRAADSIERDFVDMFRAEWRRQRGDEPLRSIAVVDVDPQRQYLSPEFALFAQLFRAHGIAAVVADPDELELRGDLLWHRDLKIDLIYNRLTDFSLSAPSSAVLAEAYLRSLVVLTPHPRAHALYADKRNLTVLCDEDLLRSWGVAESIRNVLRHCIPRTVLVTNENCEELWKERQHFFFKPYAGYGGKAAYRGDKITRRVWNEISSGNYIAQETVPAGQRRLLTQRDAVTLKVDVRNYVYERVVQLVAARMYQGQTTNFRTTGGGFAPVLTVDDTCSWKFRCDCVTGPEW
jgi:hypothetical protein